MRSVYANYKELHQMYGHIIRPLANSLKNQAKFFYGQIIGNVAVSDVAYPANDLLIDDVVLNTISDLDRIKAYHAVDNPTRYKYAAYIGFWWQRSKPFACKVPDYAACTNIFVKAKTKKLEDRLFFREFCKSINELFITDAILSFVEILADEVRCANSAQTFVYTDMQDSLHYFLRYRHYSAQELELFLKGLCTCPLVRQ